MDAMHGMTSRETSKGSHVGLYIGHPDTIVMMFQRRTMDDKDTLTTTLPLSREAFWTLIDLGNKLKESVGGTDGR